MIWLQKLNTFWVFKTIKLFFSLTALKKYFIIKYIFITPDDLHLILLNIVTYVFKCII